MCYIVQFSMDGDTLGSIIHNVTMTTFEFVNRFLVLCKYVTCERLHSHHSLKTLKKMGGGNSSYRCLLFSAFQDKSTYSISPVFVRTVSG